MIGFVCLRRGTSGGDECPGQIKEGEMGRAFRVHGEVRNALTFLLERLKGTGHSENIGLYRGMILKYTLRKWY
jgi:hypothetical protein